MTTASTDVVTVELAGEQIRRQSDALVDRLIKQHRERYADELTTIDTSDLERQVYEGGLKVWEAAYDLAEAVATVDVAGKRILELGCGAALPSIVAAKKGASHVVCQDYNSSVIELVTSPNLRLNGLDESRATATACSWDKWSECPVVGSATGQFDVILTSETIYEAADYESLHGVLDAALSGGGVIVLAAKMVYFGKTGDYFAFADFVQEKGVFRISSSRQIDAPVQRIVAKLVRV